MSQYTREEILKMIEENGGPEGLNLSGRDLSHIDLGREAIEQEFVRWRERHDLSAHLNSEEKDEELPMWQKATSKKIPIWYSLWRYPTHGGLNLQKVDLRGSNLMWANLQGAFLREATLQGATLWGAKLQKTYLEGANLERTLLAGTDLQNANLVGATLQKARLEGASLQDASLIGAKLEEANLKSASLEHVDFSRIASLRGARWHNATLDRTRMRWDQVPPIGEELAKDYDSAKEAYLLLKDNFNDLGHYDWAREAYIKEREMERNAHWPPWRARTYHNDEFEKIPGNSLMKLLKRLRLYLKYTTRHDVLTWLVLTFFKLTSMYGQRVRFVLVSGAFWIFLFALLYPFVGVVSTSSGGKALSWLQSFIYSVASFATLELSGFEATTPLAQLLTSLEALLGIVWLAYFVYAFTNMMRSS